MDSQGTLGDDSAAVPSGGAPGLQWVGPGMGLNTPSTQNDPALPVWGPRAQMGAGPWVRGMILTRGPHSGGWEGRPGAPDTRDTCLWSFIFGRGKGHQQGPVELPVLCVFAVYHGSHEPQVAARHYGCGSGKRGGQFVALC